MIAKFIGCDGSMGLHHGEVYKITITEKSQYIWVRWRPTEIVETALQLLSGSPCRCPYRSEQTLRENWEIVG